MRPHPGKLENKASVSGKAANGRKSNGSIQKRTSPRRATSASKKTNGAWSITSSDFAQNTVNPIRRMVDVMKLESNPEKKLIKLSIGDPTICGVLNPAAECLQAVKKSVSSGEFNGYPNSVGYVEARNAVVTYLDHPDAPITNSDVILTSGCSHALELAITFLCNRGDNIVIPRPGFPLYATVAGSLGVTVKYYDLLPEENWNVDLASLRNSIDGRTRAIITNSPSNPCGGVFSRQHTADIVAIAEECRVPIISDEVYERVVYGGAVHVPFAHVGQKVPILTVGAISKRFLLPGWRVGWLVVHDQQGILTPIRKDLVSLTQRILGPCSVMQGALADILEKTPESLFEKTCQLFEDNAKKAFSELSECPGLSPVMPSGAMYMMVKIDIDNFPAFDTDIQFTERLIAEESVFCLPTKSFACPGYVRIVLATSRDLLSEACGRIREFCEKHYSSPRDS